MVVFSRVMRGTLTVAHLGLLAVPARHTKHTRKPHGAAGKEFLPNGPDLTHHAATVQCWAKFCIKIFLISWS